MANGNGLFARAELTVGTGENRFSMKRGSFSYRQTIRGKTRLVRCGSESAADGVRTWFEHPKTHERAALLRREEDGREVISLELPGDCAWNRFWLTLPSDPSEHIYGCGEVYSTLDLKGEKVRIWVAEHQNTNRIARKLLREKLFGRRPEHTLPFGKYESYYAQPTFVSSGRYYVHADVNAYAEFDFRKPDRTTLYFQEPPTLYGETAESFPAL